MFILSIRSIFTPSHHDTQSVFQVVRDVFRAGTWALFGTTGTFRPNAFARRWAFCADFTKAFSSALGEGIKSGSLFFAD
jgi:hypothetical protein